LKHLSDFKKREKIKIQKIQNLFLISFFAFSNSFFSSSSLFLLKKDDTKVFGWIDCVIINLTKKNIDLITTSQINKHVYTHPDRKKYTNSTNLDPTAWVSASMARMDGDIP
jgi:hypothetical protein